MTMDAPSFFQRMHLSTEIFGASMSAPVHQILPQSTPPSTYPTAQDATHRLQQDATLIPSATHVTVSKLSTPSYPQGIHSKLLAGASV